ncbi:hypothetical protein [Capnocytophaga sp. oral taxon 326]|uniref:hypothetical protein n=1 Tax=Capnocytophaga sp. oral taxon 326 TaxID=712212 RepID=UPI0002A1B04A|nr:hypothetical protein [Capnocytophaga sp. oral taxon 326]EKY16939.1 hypothetical protein HMPREF9073_01712 [Capnocytophaga sp. oral taxon 326 str. F0382]
MYSKVFLTACSLALLLVSCKKDDNNNSESAIISKSSGKYLLETSVKNPDGMSGSSYIQLFNTLSGSLNNSQAEQVDFGSSVQVEGNDVYLFDTMKGVGGIVRWTYDPTTQKLTKGATLPGISNSMVGHLEKVSATKAYVPMYTQGVVWIINPQTMQKTGEINLAQYAHGDSSPEPAMGILRDGKYYLCLNQIDPGAGWQPYANYQQCDVAIINPQTDVVEKVVSETTTKLTFPTRPMAQCKGMLFTNEAGDIYIATAGYFGYSKDNTKCGFLCIPKGSTEFDSSKSWDISTTTIAGTTYKPASVYNCQYIGNGKAVAYVGIVELGGSNPYTAKNAMAVLIDLSAKTISQINGIPLTDGHSIFITKHNGNILFGAFGTDKIGLFAYNPTTGAVEQVLTTTGNPAFFHAF